MGLIRILPQNLVNQIAAGEVVERPASVVKELVENAIDAGARRIDVSFRDGGKSYISVADDGRGMGREDLAACVLRYATSKLPLDDLGAIEHLGFRGEALPSIASVSKMKITTNDGASGGLELAVRGGLIEKIAPAGAPPGTKAEVFELFYNVPARFAFLASERGEASAIHDSVERIAMCYPDLEFHINGERHFIPCERLSRAGQIFGRDFAENAVEIRGMAVSGFVSRPSFTRGTSGQQYLFVNGRSVRDKVLLGAVRAAYSDVIERGRFASCALWVNLPPADVDVNAHPQKAEVRFVEARRVKAIVISAIRKALSDAEAKPAFFRPSARTFEPLANRQMSVDESGTGFGESINPDSVAWGDSDPRERPLGSARGQVFATYIIAQAADGVVIADAHALAERITYEKIKASVAKGGVERQILLIPESVEVGEAKIGALLESAPELALFGLCIEEFGPGAVAVREVPALLGEFDACALVREIADEIAVFGRAASLEDKISMVAKTYACHTSYRAGKTLSIDQMNALLREAELWPNAGVCNHGRNSLVKLSKGELDKMFGR